MQQTALITGATGLLGRQVLNAFQRDSANWKVFGQGFSRASGTADSGVEIVKADLLDEGNIVALLEQTKPNVVVHCAANRFPDKCDQNPAAARKINVAATQSLAQATSSRSILLIYISTDYVFPGRPGEAPYATSAQTDPPNIYGETKRDGEVAVLEQTRESRLGVVLRVPVLYGPAQQASESAVNVLVDAVWKAQDAGAGIKMDDWAIRYPTHTADVGRVCRDIAVKYLAGAGAVGAGAPSNDGELKSLPRILQFSSEDRMTKYQICQKLAEILGLPLPGMIPVREGPKPGEVQRPFDTHLSTEELKRIGIEVGTQSFEAWW
ncbi:dTDP-4-dehydrorhamnose reductase [Blastomyces gilchristii SLH14081]|uniref:dTDP-4-dehydrorhamnose reductase n=1 Tax=Blastomyces gilchristii (strain SLH14081) TaxID=559298 RepID=A0A179UD43_BLAGS|nr:dTDP-4-dehydrorhamnose reductase [Blastomyces gilchristii SLH14081]OAT05077.1 dTDP-4-dehydrorhamnose reductase [Blastomyces gilchristii SLH14081]